LIVVIRSADYRRVAVGGQRDGIALGGNWRRGASTDELGVLWRQGTRPGPQSTTADPSAADESLMMMGTVEPELVRVAEPDSEVEAEVRSQNPEVYTMSMARVSVKLNVPEIEVVTPLTLSVKL
jgi:hypothetical protein